MEATVREASSGDRARLALLLGAQLAEHGIALSEERLGAAVDGVFAVPERGLFLLAEEEGAAVGVAYLSFVWALEHGGTSAWLEELYVVPARRDRGIGTTLLRAACAAARTRGCAAVDLEIERAHARAAGLYRREGFRAHERSRWVRLFR